MLQKDDGRPAREPILNTPALITWIIGLLGSIFLVEILLPEEESWTLINSFGVVPLRYATGGAALDSVLPGVLAQIVPLITYSLLHGSPAHLILNAAWLLAIGTPVAQKLGSGRFLLFWAVTAVAAALLYIAIKGANPVPMIGASGAISGLFGGLARFLFGHRADGRSGALDRRVVLFAAIWLALNMAIGVWGIGAEAGVSAIAWEAHAGGFIAGLLLFPLFERRGGG